MKKHFRIALIGQGRPKYPPNIGAQTYSGLLMRIFEEWFMRHGFREFLVGGDSGFELCAAHALKSMRHIFSGLDMRLFLTDTPYPARDARMVNVIWPEPTGSQVTYYIGPNASELKQHAMLKLAHAAIYVSALANIELEAEAQAQQVHFIHITPAELARIHVENDYAALPKIPLPVGTTLDPVAEVVSVARGDIPGPVFCRSR